MHARLPRLLTTTVGLGLVLTALSVAPPSGADPSSDNAVVTFNDGANIGTLDTSTGAVTVFAGPSHAGLFGDAFSTDGNLYGLEGGELVRIDQTTGASTAIGGNQNLSYGLDQAPDGTMYAASYGGSRGAGLYTVDTATGAATFVGSSRGAMDVTFDCTGTLWGVDGGQLFSYNLATGAVDRTVTLTGDPSAGSIMSLFVDAAGDMLATTYQEPDAELFKVDPDTGALTSLGTTTASMPHGGDDANACADLTQQTALDAVGGSATYGHGATLTATLGAAGTGIAGESVAFEVDGSPVGTATTDSSGVATLTGVSTTGIDAGSHPGAVTASFAGDASFRASDGTGDLSVAQAAQPLSFTSTAPSPVVGSAAYTPSATGGDSANPVVFSVDAATTSAACTIADGVVTFHHAGSCVLDADQAGTTDYTAATTVQQSIPVGTATTHATVAVGPQDVTASVAATDPAAGTPTGSVQFSVNGAVVGTAPLDQNGTATLAYAVPAGETQAVAAAYLGSADFTGSVASTNRTDPTITATVSSARPRTAHGWFSGPVTVRFTCAAGSAQLAAPCPAPVTVTRSAAGQSLTRIITTTDGGAAASTVTGLNIDRTRPSVRVHGARAGAVYRGARPQPACAAADALSGVVHCAVRVGSARNGVIHYAVTATNGAGLSATTRGSYRVLTMWLQGVAWHDGRFDVRAGQTVTVVIASRIRPRYEWAAPATTGPTSKPRGGDTAFYASGGGRWQIPVTLSPTMDRRFQQWNLGARVGQRSYQIRIAFRR